MKKIISVLLFFVFIGIIYTFPLVFHIKSFLLGEPGDTYGVVWRMWIHNAGGASAFSCSLHTDKVNAPFGALLQMYHPVTEVAIYFVSSLFGEIFAYNLIVMLIFVLSAFTMYMLVKYLTKSHIAGLFSGIIFGFSPFAVSHAIAGHLAFGFLMPLYVYTLFILKERKRFIYAVLSGIVLCMNCFTWLYYGYFMIFFTLCFIFYDLIAVLKEKGDCKKFIIKWCIFLIVVLAIMIPYAFQILAIKGNVNEIVSRPMKDLFTFSAKPWDYLLPSVYNPFLGKLFKPVVDSLLIGSNYAEQTLYLGFMTIIFTLYALWIWRKKSINASIISIIKFFFFTGLIMLILSAPPFVPIGKYTIENGEIISKYKIYFPSYLLFKIFPMFRVYSRFGVLVMLCAGVLAGIGLSEFLKNLKKYHKTAVLSVFAVLILEFAFIPKFIDLKNIPEVYSWLKDEPGDFIIAEYPIESNIHGLNEEYMFYQRIHNKKMFNGPVEGGEADKIKSGTADILKANSIRTLKSLGVKYIIVHADKYFKYRKIYPDLSKNRNLVLTRNFEKDLVYKIK